MIPAGGGEGGGVVEGRWVMDASVMMAVMKSVMVMIIGEATASGGRMKQLM